MAGLATPGELPRAGFHGLGSIFEFTNGDGALVRTNCGQAAAATFLKFHGKLALAQLQAPPPWGD
jgi:hypothetical protein